MPQTIKEGFNRYLDEIIKAVMKNDNLMKILFYDTPDCLIKPILTQEQKNALIYNRVFPHRFIPNVSTSACSYLNLGFGNFKEISNVFQAGKIGFYMVSHKDLWKMNGGLRPIFMLEEIKEVAKQLEGLGLGKLKMESCDEYYYNNDFCGYFVTYSITDFKNLI